MNEIDLSIITPAFWAGVLVLSTHVPLGRRVLARGIIFIDLAIAQIAGLGVIAASNLGLPAEGLEAQIAAVLAALSGAVILSWAERKWPETQEALIGVFFVLAATGSVLLLNHNPHGGEHLRDLLVGQILWVDYQQLIPTLLIYSVLLLLWFKFAGQGLFFYVLFAVAITASVQLVGVYLVFASLIIPALVMRQFKRFNLLVGYGVGVTGYFFGLIGSAFWDMPSGAMIVWALALAALFCTLLRYLYVSCWGDAS